MKRVVMTMTKTKSQNNKSIKDILNSPIAIIVALAILVLCLMGYSRYLIKVNKLYQFSGYVEEVSILNGTIYSSRDIGYLGDSKIIYTGIDSELTEFEIGYYIKDGDDYVAIAKVKNNEEIGKSVNLKRLLETTDFSFTETRKGAGYLNKDIIKKINDMVFKVKGKDTSGKDIDIEVPLEVTKINK